MKYVIIDLETNKSEELPLEEIVDATRGLELVPGAVKVWRAEQYLVVELPN